MSFRRHLYTTLAAVGVLAMTLIAPMVTVNAMDANDIASSVSSMAPASTATADVRTAANDPTNYYTYNGFLPINRWTPAMGILHDRQNAFVSADLTEKMLRGTVQSLGLLTASAQIFGTSEILRFALNFDVLGNEIGATVDAAVGGVGSTLLTDPLLLGTVFGGIVLFIIVRAFRQRQRGETNSMIKQLVASVIVVAIISVMTTSAIGANDNKVTDSDGNVTYNPAVGSPVWAMTVLSDTVSTFAAAPAAAMVNWNPALAGTGSSGGAPFSCDLYLAYLKQRSDDVASSYQSGYAAYNNGDQVAISKIINSLWERTGLEAWKSVQFGSDNPYTDFMYCHALESKVAPAAEHAWYMNNSMGEDVKAVPAGTRGPKSPVYHADNAGDHDASMIAWAACRPNSNPSGPSSFTVADGWRQTKDGDTWISNDECWDWWHATDPGQIPDDFRIGGQMSEIRDKTDDRRVLNFVDNLHGTNLAEVGQGVIVTASVQVAAVGLSVVFAGLALLVIFSKIYMLILVLMLFFILIVAMFARAPMERLAPTAQKLIGITIYSFSLSITVSFIAIITIMLMSMGEAIFGAGNPLNFVWSGIAPLAAAVTLHYIFKNGFKIPSPMTRTGAVAWGAAGGAAGAAIGSGLANAAKSRAQFGARQLARRGGSAIMNKATGGLVGKGFGGGAKHGMDGGRRRGDDQDSAGQGVTAMTQDEYKKERTAAMLQRRAESKQNRDETKAGVMIGNAKSHVVAGGRAAGGAALSGMATGARMLHRDPEKRAEAVQAAKASLNKGREAVQNGISAAPQVVGREARAAGSTAALLGRAIREDPKAAASFAAAKARGAAVNTAKKVGTNRLIGAGAIAGAVALGPITSVPTAGYFAFKGASALRKRHVQSKQEQNTYTESYIAKKRDAARSAEKKAEASVSDEPSKKPKG